MIATLTTSLELARAQRRLAMAEQREHEQQLHASSYRSLREAGVDGAGDAGRRTALLEGLGSNALGSLVALLAGAAMLLGVFVGLARLLRIHEFSVMVAMIRGRLGR